MASHEHRSADILPWPVDHERSPRFVPPVDPTTVERAYNERGQHFVDEDEGVYEFMRETRASVRRLVHRVGIVCYVVAVSAACYFAFQLGRGAL